MLCMMICGYVSTQLPVSALKRRTGRCVPTGAGVNGVSGTVAGVSATVAQAAQQNNEYAFASCTALQCDFASESLRKIIEQQAETIASQQNTIAQRQQSLAALLESNATQQDMIRKLLQTQGQLLNKLPGSG